MNIYLRVLITFFNSFLIGGGGAYLTVASNGQVSYLSISAAIVTGLIAGAQAVQKLYEVPPLVSTEVK